MAENEKAIEIFISPFAKGEKYKGQTINFIKTQRNTRDFSREISAGK